VPLVSVEEALHDLVAKRGGGDMSARRLSSLVTVIVCGVALSSAVALPATRQARSAQGVIRSVTFGGSPAKPVVTVVGSGLRVPPPSPSKSPSNQPLCPKVINGNAGLDYGTKFYVTAFADDKLKYSAGRYRPALKELDCIGIVVLSKSPARVQFGFGAAYSQADFGYPHIVDGDLIEVVLNGAAYGLVVHYG
jgi:hypothetical protein